MRVVLKILGSILLGAEYLGFVSSRSLKTREKYTNCHLCLLLLAYMATSGGHFSRPSGMGEYWSYSG